LTQTVVFSLGEITNVCSVCKLANCHLGLLRQEKRQALLQPSAGRSQANVALVQQQVAEQDLALLDYGATNSVSNDVSLFTSLRPTSMNLIIASTDQFPVKQVGDVVLPTPQGPLRVSNVLFCPNIKGTIILVGKFKSLDGKVDWDGNKYAWVQDGVLFESVESQNCCFIPLLHANSQFSSVVMEPRLLHECFGPFSLRMLHCTIKAGAIRSH
jgi:hypothetical protein